MLGFSVEALIYYSFLIALVTGAIGLEEKNKLVRTVSFVMCMAAVFFTAFLIPQALSWHWGITLLMTAIFYALASRIAQSGILWYTQRGFALIYLILFATAIGFGLQSVYRLFQR